MNSITEAKAQALPPMGMSARSRLGKHQCSVAALSQALAEALGLDEAHCRCIKQAAALHDVGKLYVSALVIDKDGPHTWDETLTVRQHSIFGHTHLSAFKQTPVTKLAAMIALQHHERFDGTGYPYGLSKDHITLESRITSICDVYDALREERPYKAGIGHDAAMQAITCGDERTKPSMFDPAILDAMIKHQEKVRSVFDSRHQILAD